MSAMVRASAPRMRHRGNVEAGTMRSTSPVTVRNLPSLSLARSARPVLGFGRALGANDVGRRPRASSSGSVCHRARRIVFSCSGPPCADACPRTASVGTIVRNTSRGRRERVGSREVPNAAFLASVSARLRIPSGRRRAGQEAARRNRGSGVSRGSNTAGAIAAAPLSCPRGSSRSAHARSAYGPPALWPMTNTPR